MQEIKKINLSLDYETYPLKELNEGASVFSGFAFKSKDFSDKGIPIVKIKNIQNKSVDLKEVQYFPLDKVNNKHKKFFLKNNDVLIAMTGQGSLGRVGRINLESNEYVLLNQRVGKFVVDEKNLHLNYLYHVISSDMYEKILFDRGTGSGQPNLSPEIILGTEIPMPNLTTQKKISSILDNINSKINLNKKINKNLEELAKAIYRHHFIDFKPYALGGLMKHSSQGMIPKDWSVQSIEEFVDDMKNGGTPKRGESDYWDNGTVPWLKTGEINNNIIIKSEEHITELGLKNSSAKLLPINSIIMALYGKGTAARIGLLKFEATTNQACCAMICNDFNKTLFLYLFLLFNQKEIENLASGSVQQNLSKDLIANLELVVPPIEIIDNLPFKEIFDTIANNYFEIEYLINLRDTLLPKLMSGEIDVSKINCDLELKYNYMKYLFNQIHTPMSKSVV